MVSEWSRTAEWTVWFGVSPEGAWSEVETFAQAGNKVGKGRRAVGHPGRRHLPTLLSRVFLL